VSTAFFFFTALTLLPQWQQKQEAKSQPVFEVCGNIFLWGITVGEASGIC